MIMDNSKIASLYNDGKLNDNDIISLNQIRKGISDSYSKGKISELHYNLLNKKIQSLVNINTNKNSDNMLESKMKLTL